MGFRASGLAFGVLDLGLWGFGAQGLEDISSFRNLPEITGRPPLSERSYLHAFKTAGNLPQLSGLRVC